jgi:hypothetical protein
MVSVEMPRFAEPPVRLELTVVHEAIQPDRARHVVELQSFSRAAVSCSRRGCSFGLERSRKA